MHVRLILLLLLPVWAFAQGFAGLERGGAGFAPVTPPADLRFPADHGAHPAFRIEWWYVTANLTAANGTPMGAQWTLFRQGTGAAGAGPWAAEQIWMGHAAVTTPGRHLYAEKFARGGIGQAGVTPAPFSAWIDNWRMAGAAAEAGADPLDRLEIIASGEGFSYALRLHAEGPLVPQGNAGYSLKSPQGQASYYYSQPFYTVSGQVTIEGRAVDVTGQAWLDREWSSQPLRGDQTGWDWIALHLPDGAKLMVYRLRFADGSAYAPGTYIAPDGTPEPLADGALMVQPLETGEVAGRQIPLRWRVALPGRGIDVTLAPVNRQSFMNTAFPYWEGPIRFTGSVEGVGYLEMTGYGDE